MSLYNLFETDHTSEQEGFFLKLQDNDLEITFLLARAGGANKKYTSLMQSLMRPHQHAAQTGNLKDSVAEDVMIKVMSKTLILGWDNVLDRDGEEVEFTEENCSHLLRELPELRDVIWAEANKVANFINVEREDSAKN